MLSSPTSVQWTAFSMSFVRFRECYTFIDWLTCSGIFEDADVTHVEGNVDPIRDLEVRHC